MYHAFSFFEHFWSMACHRSRWCVESLGFVDLSRRCHLFCHQHLAFSSVKAFFFLFSFSVFFRCSRGFSREWLFLFCCQAICIISLEECNSMRLSSWLQHLGFNGLTDWLFVWHATGETWWNMVKHEVYMGANITTNSPDLAQCLGHLRRTLSTLVRWQLRFTWVLQVRKNLKTPLNLTEISISEVAFEIMRSLCHCGTWRDGWCPMVEASRLYLLHSDDDCSCLRLWSESWGSHVEETLLFTLVVQGRNGLIDLWREGPKKICMDLHGFLWISLDLFGFVDRVAWQSIAIRQDLEARDVEVRPCGVLAEARQPVTESTTSRWSAATTFREYLWILGFFLSYLWSRNQGPLQSSHNTSVQMRVIRLRKHHTPSLISRKFNIFVHNFQFLCPGDRCRVKGSDVPIRCREAMTPKSSIWSCSFVSKKSVLGCNVRWQSSRCVFGILDLHIYWDLLTWIFEFL